ncbi:MAG: GAK system CofD-like protein [Sedimentitalea sp.]|uniref:GAK system CofD-like protein n=1 Tax=Sedimentitalea sp. TaxID=2048915 RepID=UPI00326546EF
MSELKITRNVQFPDALRISRATSLPSLGPRFLFFSGGSALNDIARRLKRYTHNSCHLITPFDSGGSSQVLREAFDMPAVGDLRSRLMALADETDLGQPDIYRLFTYRFSSDAKASVLRAEFETVLSGQHELMRAISQPMRSLILTQLRVFSEHCPDDFSFAGASLGNLILAGGYLANDRALEPVLFLMSKMVAVLGTVRAIVDKNLAIGAHLTNGEIVLGQRQITGKEVAPISAPIQNLFFAKGSKPVPRDKVVLPKRNRKLIEGSDLICFPPGSLYTSVIANLLPSDVGASIARSGVPKVYIPSLGTDPECPDMDLCDRVSALLAALRADAGDACANSDLMTAIICDKQAVSPAEIKRVHKEHGIPCVPLPLAKTDQPDRYDPECVCEALLSLA